MNLSPDFASFLIVVLLWIPKDAKKFSIFIGSDPRMHLVKTSSKQIELNSGCSWKESLKIQSERSLGGSITLCILKLNL